MLIERLGFTIEFGFIELNMGCRRNHEIHWVEESDWVEEVLHEIDCELPEFGSKSPSDYLDWEFEVNRCIGDFPHSSHRLSTVIARKLVGYTRIWRSVHMKRRKLAGHSERVSYNYIKGAIRQNFCSAILLRLVI